MQREENWSKVKEIFWDALDQPQNLRSEFLQSACGGDLELLAEVESLLEASQESNPLLEDDKYNLASLINASDRKYEGKSFGHYKIIREIGHGGMGAVFLAERNDGEFRQQVALKIVRQTIVEAELERRFKRERQILASLNHPNIAKLLDGGVNTEGEPFLAMEYIEGEPLLDFAEKENLSIEERLKLFLKICLAVDYAHQNLVIHRDIKPSNILVTKDGEPKLLDFGLAKILNAEIFDQDSTKTATAFRAFTLGYASPEQISGKVVTTASDVYSLSVVLYELLTGFRPFHFEDQSLDEILKSIGNNDPPKPSDIWRDTGRRGNVETAKTKHETNPHITVPNPQLLKGDLDNICLMGLRREPERRYKSVKLFAEDIEKYLKGFPVSARPNTFDYRALKFLKRNKIAAAAVGFGILAIILSVALFSKIYFENQNSLTQKNNAINSTGAVKTLAVLPLKSLSNPPADQELRTGMADSIVTKLGTVKQIVVRPTSSTINYLDQKYDVQAVGKELKVDSILEGSLQKEGNRLRVNLQMVSVADGQVIWSESFTNNLSNILSGQESIANRVSRLMELNTNSTLADSTSSNLAAQDAFLKGNYALNTSVRKIEDIFAARDDFERAIRIDNNFARAYSGLALTNTLAGSLNLLSPRECYPSAEKAARRALEIDPNLAAAYIALGDVEADYNWNWEAAETNYKHALELSPNLASAHQNYSEFLARQGRFEESNYHSDLAQQLDPTRINYATVRALHYLYEHRFDEAIVQSKATIERDENAYLAYLYLNIAYNIKGDYTDAEIAGKRAAAISRVAAPDLFVLGNTYALMKDNAKIDENLVKLNSLSKRQYVDPVFFAIIYGYRGDKDKAFEYLDKCYKEKSYWMTALKVFPVFDGLRSDARFSALLAKMNLNN